MQTVLRGNTNYSFQILDQLANSGGKLKGIMHEGVLNVDVNHTMLEEVKRSWMYAKLSVMKTENVKLLATNEEKKGKDLVRKSEMLSGKKKKLLPTQLLRSLVLMMQNYMN